MKIADIELGEKPLLLAPMEDVTDPSFRYMCKRFGADVVYTEFISSDGLIRDAAKSLKKLEIDDAERPVGIQIYGHLIDPMVEAARMAEAAGPDIIDINFGCPVKKIAGRGAGSGMMRDVPLMVEMTRRIVEAVGKPVTVKTRLGWDDESKNIEEIALRLQDVGIAALTIHGRTRAQMYRGEADWTLIGKVKNNPQIRIPIIGNGDVDSGPKAREMFDRYGVDGVEIRLDKRVPFGAGLGGGSSDGTAVLLALDGLFGLRLAEAELVALAAELGSDTAFFVRNTPQLCTGRGEIMEPYPLCLAGMTLVVVKPDVGVSTREAYAGVRPHVPEVPLAERLRRPVVEWQGLVTNDFEPHIFAAHPAIREARDSLLAAGAVYASMSGSGSAVFGLFDDAQKAGNLRLQTPFVYTL